MCRTNYGLVGVVALVGAVLCGCYAACAPCDVLRRSMIAQLRCPSRSPMCIPLNPASDGGYVLHERFGSDAVGGVDAAIDCEECGGCRGGRASAKSQ